MPSQPRHVPQKSRILSTARAGLLRTDEMSAQERSGEIFAQPIGSFDDVRRDRNAANSVRPASDIERLLLQVSTTCANCMRSKASSALSCSGERMVSRPSPASSPCTHARFSRAISASTPPRSIRPLGSPAKSSAAASTAKRYRHRARAHQPAAPAVARVARANRSATQEPQAQAFLNAAQVYPYSDGTIYQIYTAPGAVTDIALNPVKR